MSEDSSLTSLDTTSASPKSPLSSSYSNVAASCSLSPMLSDVTSMLYSLENPLDAQMAKSSIDEQVGPCTQLPLVKVENNDQGWTTVSCKKRCSGEVMLVPPPRTPEGSPYYDELIENLAQIMLANASKPSFTYSLDRKSTRLNSSHSGESRMPSSA